MLAEPLRDVASGARTVRNSPAMTSWSVELAPEPCLVLLVDRLVPELEQHQMEAVDLGHGSVPVDHHAADSPGSLTIRKVTADGWSAT